jgi:hypothetical protein
MSPEEYDSIVIGDTLEFKEGTGTRYVLCEVAKKYEHKLDVIIIEARGGNRREDPGSHTDYTKRPALVGNDGWSIIDKVKTTQAMGITRFI